MPVGLGTKLPIMQQSPYDQRPRCQTPPPAQQETPDSKAWVPSRYNIRAVTPDHRLVLWNSYRGSMTVFDAEQREQVETLLTQKGFSAPETGVVRYLARRGYLIPRGTDEYRRVQSGFGHQHYRSDLLQLLLLASEDCNFRCTYCYEKFARGTMESTVREGVKNLLLSRLSALRSFSVSWFGGEPLYGFEAIEDLAPFFVDVCGENDVRFSSQMTTNAYLLTPDVAEKLLAWKVSTYQITLDGPAVTHDCSRPGRDGSPTFATIIDNLDSLSTRPEQFRVDLRVNFSPDNYPHLNDLLLLLRERLQADPRFRLRFRAVGKWGGPEDEHINVCGRDEAERIELEMKAEARRLGIESADDIREIRGLGAEVCYAARPYNFLIGASGKVMKCTIDLDMKDRNVVGQLTPDGNLNLDPDKFALWTEPAFEKDTKCQKCVVLPACQGSHCPQIRFDYNRSPCTPLRKLAKQELVATAMAAGDEVRRVTVGPGSSGST